MKENQLFYLQDSRGYVGNDMLWWAKGGGYTTNVSQAETFTLEKAQAQHNCRHTDLPWPIEYINARTRPVVDMQTVRHHEAYKGSGISIVDYQSVRLKHTTRCEGCGRFLSEQQYWSGPCPKCGTDNRP